MRPPLAQGEYKAATLQEGCAFEIGRDHNEVIVAPLVCSTFGARAEQNKGLYSEPP
jgi:hypothetical protein